MDLQKHIRVEDNSPLRCQAATKNGQCRYQRVEGSENCGMHNGTNKLKAQQLRNYNIQKYQDRIQDTTSSSNIKNLREEIVLCRILIENIYNSCESPEDMLIHSTKIGDLLTRCQKLIQACQSLDEKTNKLLDKSELLIMCEGIIKVISDEIDDPDTLESIANQIQILVTETLK